MPPFCVFSNAVATVAKTASIEADRSVHITRAAEPSQPAHLRADVTFRGRIPFLELASVRAHTWAPACAYERQRTEGPNAPHNFCYGLRQAMPALRTSLST